MGDPMASKLLHIWQRFQCHHGQLGCPILAIRAKRMAVACSWANSWTCEVQTWVLTEDSHCPDRFLSAHFQHFSTILPWWNPTLVKYIAWIQDVHDQTFILRIISQYSVGIFVAIQSLFILFFLSPQAMHNPKFPHTCLGTRAYIEVIANKTEQEFLSIWIGILFFHIFPSFSGACYLFICPEAAIQNQLHPRCWWKATALLRSRCVALGPAIPPRNCWRTDGAMHDGPMKNGARDKQVGKKNRKYGEENLIQ